MNNIIEYNIYVITRGATISTVGKKSKAATLNAAWNDTWPVGWVTAFVAIEAMLSKAKGFKNDW